MPFKRWKKRIGETLDLPEDLFSSGPRITLIGFEMVIVEDFQQIIGFSEKKITLQVGSGQVDLWGDNLVLAEMSTHEIEIKGQIGGLEFKKEGPCIRE